MGRRSGQGEGYDGGESNNTWPLTTSCSLHAWSLLVCACVYVLCFRRRKCNFPRRTADEILQNIVVLLLLYIIIMH